MNDLEFDDMNNAQLRDYILLLKKGIKIFDETFQLTRSQLEKLYTENIRLKDEIEKLTYDNIRQQNVILILDGLIKRNLPETTNSTQD